MDYCCLLSWETWKDSIFERIFFFFFLCFEIDLQTRLLDLAMLKKMEFFNLYCFSLF